jgi:uncharacterized protein YndB with AHSA1/START domain
MSAGNSSNEIRIVRVYDAPVGVVWDAWTDPAQVAQWWGPRGFTLTTHSKDLRPGGTWRYTMHGPDGVDYPNVTRYHEVVQNQRLVYDHGGSDDSPPMFRVTVEFQETRGKTRMEMCMTLATAEAAREARVFIKKAGGDATWDRLAEYLEKGSSGKERFVINRSFGVTPQRMFELWTNPSYLSKWLPPTGFDMQVIQSDVKPGGSLLFVMTGGGDAKMYGRFNYIRIDAPEHLVYVQQFCDAQGKVSRHPKAPTWPETMLTSVEFAAEEPNRTRVTVTFEPSGNVNAEELETFVKGRAGMTLGWTGSFDKLEAYIDAN